MSSPFAVKDACVIQQTQLPYWTVIGRVDGLVSEAACSSIEGEEKGTHQLFALCLRLSETVWEHFCEDDSSVVTHYVLHSVLVSGPVKPIKILYFPSF